jgi:putative peptidoglycan lipid II flippase
MVLEKIKKLFFSINRESQTITSAAIIIGGLSLVSRIIGIFRDRILASQFGVGDTLDVYYAAFRLPDLVYNLLILGAISAGLIPVFTTLMSKKKDAEAWMLINRVLNLMFLALLLVCCLLFIFAPWIVPLITPGFDAEKNSLVIVLSRIMFLSPLLLGLSAIFSSVLQSFRRFLIYSLAPIFYNLGIILGALYFVPLWGIYGLAWGVVLGAGMHMIVQLIPMFFVGFKYRLDFNFRDKNVIEVMKMMIPRTISLAITQINFVIITIIASTLAAGSLTIFNLANNLQNFPLGIFGISLGVASLPILSALAAEDKMKKFSLVVGSTFRQILFFIFPISVLFYVLRAQIVRVILGAGEFGWQDTRLTAACLAIFCFGLFAQGTYPLVIRGFYALHNTKTPFYVGISSMVINVIAMLFFCWAFSFVNDFSFFVTAMLRLTDLWGLVDFRILAVPSAITVSSIFELSTLLFLLRRKVGDIDGVKIFDSGVRIIFASLGAGLLAYLTLNIIDDYVSMQKFFGILIQGASAGLVGVAGYVLLGYVLNMEEMYTFINSFKVKLFKRAVVMAEDNISEGDKG